ncbi:Ferredoxin--NADP reductase [Emticicia aquatica]|uniref:Flavin-containing monooxygenase 5 n=1 Tax=Emticicia aquatica TaxID=1681835 RepID=A0ABN8EY28_9BACT|nr:NAD(P)-binding domain-containing protein [Emticicia aquatica]CAH0996604.1 Ferredoxin--NADP reductase [Emticicia aquatica]
MKQVCIIGAGSSGITAAKAMKEQGISFDCFEKGSDIGGVWRFNNDNGLSSAYRSLHINTNRVVMAYSDFPMPDEYPMFPHHSHIITYFENYVDHFKLRDNITFNTTVVDVVQNPDNTYKVTLDNRQSFDYQYVIVANGHHWNPRFPNPAFKGQFTGEILHSHYYKEAEQVQNKDVLVVGIGNSAVDIACEAARLHTGKVVISTRSSAYITPNWIWSMPFDNLANPLTAKLPLWLQRTLLNVTLWLARGRQEDYGVPKPNRPVLSEHPTLSQDLLNLTGRGLIKFKPNIKEIRGKTVVFEDDTEQDFDTIIYATGYKVTFPFLKHYPAFDVEESNDIRLYKKVIHPDYKNLFFLALIQPLGAIMPLAEIQAKWIAKIIKGESKIPSKDMMLKSIEEDKQKMMKRYKQTPRHTLQVDFFTYKESIEKEMK